MLSKIVKEKSTWTNVALNDQTNFDDEADYRFKCQNGGDYWWTAVIYRSVSELVFHVDHPGYFYAIKCKNKSQC